MSAAALVGRRFGAYLRLARFNTLAGGMLLLWPTLWGLWLAHGATPPTGVVTIFVVGAFAMRAFGCAINDYADRDFDGHVRRTRDRPLARGDITPAEALMVAAFFLGVALLLWWRLGDAAKLWAVPAALVAASYPYLKRFFAFPQAYLGIAFSFGIPIAYAEAQGHVPAQAWALFAANFMWVLAYDTLYAMADRDDDRKLPVKSSALALGNRDLLFVFSMYVSMLAFLSFAGPFIGLGMPFQVSLVAGMGLAWLFYRMARDRSPESCLRAFLLNHWMGALIFFGIAADVSL